MWLVGIYVYKKFALYTCLPGIRSDVRGLLADNAGKQRPTGYRAACQQKMLT